MDYLTIFKIFIKCSETESFTQAASELNTNTPMITRCIRKLEEEVGAALFIRSTRKVQLTDAGRALLDKARNIIYLIEDVKNTGNDIRSDSSGRLRAYVPDFLFSDCLSDELPLFLQDNPMTIMELMTYDGNFGRIKAEFDIAITLETPPSSPGYIQKVASIEYMICAAPDYVDRVGLPLHPQDLTALNCLVYGEQESAVWTFSSARSSVVEEVAVSGTLWSNNAKCVLESTLAGMGIARLPKWLALRHVEQGRLVTLFRTHNCTPVGSGLYAVTGERKAASLKISRFMDFVQGVVNDASQADRGGEPEDVDPAPMIEGLRALG